MWYIRNQRIVYFQALNLCALNDCHVKISQNSTIDRPCVSLVLVDMVRSCSHAKRMEENEILVFFCYTNFKILKSKSQSVEYNKKNIFKIIYRNLPRNRKHSNLTFQKQCTYVRDNRTNLSF